VIHELSLPPQFLFISNEKNGASFFNISLFNQTQYKENQKVYYFVLVETEKSVKELKIK